MILPVSCPVSAPSAALVGRTVCPLVESARSGSGSSGTAPEAIARACPAGLDAVELLVDGLGQRPNWPLEAARLLSPGGCAPRADGRDGFAVSRHIAADMQACSAGRESPYGNDILGKLQELSDPATNRCSATEGSPMPMAIAGRNGDGASAGPIPRPGAEVVGAPDASRWSQMTGVPSLAIAAVLVPLITWVRSGPRAVSSSRPPASPPASSVVSPASAVPEMPEMPERAVHFGLVVGLAVAVGSVLVGAVLLWAADGHPGMRTLLAVAGVLFCAGFAGGFFAGLGWARKVSVVSA